MPHAFHTLTMAILQQTPIASIGLYIPIPCPWAPAPVRTCPSQIPPPCPWAPAPVRTCPSQIHPPPPPPPAGVVIGFEQPLYTVSEDAGSINVGVVVRNGQLRRSVVVTVSTEDGTAQGTCQPRALTKEVCLTNCPAHG